LLLKYLDYALVVDFSMLSTVTRGSHKATLEKQVNTNNDNIDLGDERFVKM